MNDFDRWLATNDQYLADALVWLREGLARLYPDNKPVVVVMPQEQSQPPSTASTVTQHSFWNHLFQPEPPSAKTIPVDVTVQCEPPNLQPPEDKLSQSAKLARPAAMLEAEAAVPPPALVLLSQRLGLSEFERYTLLLCAAMEWDTHMAILYARAQGDPSRAHPSFALALNLFDQAAWDVMSPERPLRYWRLIEINQPGAQPLVTSVLKADERIVNYLKGLNYLDDRLTPLLLPVAISPNALPPSQDAVVDAVVAHLQVVQDRASPQVFQLLGADSQSKLLIAHEAAVRLGLTLYRLPVDAIPGQSGDQETLVRLWQRESMLMPIALYVDAAQLDRGGGPQAAALPRLLARGMGVVFVDTREPWLELGGQSPSLDVAKPTAGEQQAAWSAALGEASAELSSQLAGQFNFNVTTIGAIADAALAHTSDDRSRLGAALWGGCLGQARPALDQLAQAIHPLATWQDLELPVTETKLLHQIADQVKSRQAVYEGWGFRQRMNRGLGISVLFTGDSGTGKTMAAEVIANELGLLLYRIDLSAVVSKYIGETEKNLRKLFDAAEEGGAILFFDEADALFGKRSEVKDSHDRYANIEINYLLQRMEAFGGLAILATNMKSALDNAFLRRLRFIVNFPFPGPVERQAIWKKVFPAQTPTAELDHARLARFNLTGGSIHNVALNAAFLAAQMRMAVTMPLIFEAARSEFRKLEKPINEADFCLVESVGVKA